jgi:hypothetical protein
VYAAAIREAEPRAVLAAGARIGGLSLAVSLWWIAGLSIQATHGLDVLRYSETADVVAASSLAQEVLRGLGYWFFYGDDRLGPWIEPSVQYTQRLWLLGVTFLLPILALLGGAVARWRHRAFFVLLLVAGLTLAVGAYPWDEPSGVGRIIRGILLTDAGLAMRSLPRAVPLVVLALAVLLGSGVAALARWRPRLAGPLAAGLVVIAVAGLPPLWQRGMVPGNLQRPESLPSYWRDAAAAIDRERDGTRVLEIPGADFASYRWGNTVEPISPGLTDRPLAFRELIPYGSAPSADLLIGFDAPLQAHVGEPEALAPIARLLRAGTVLVRSDLQYERYNTPRPAELWALVGRAPGLGAPETFGDGVPNVAGAVAPLLDELTLTLDPDLPSPPAVAAVPVEDAVPVVAAQPQAAPVLVAADGSGLVDLAAAGLIDGTEVVLYGAALDTGDVTDGLDAGAALVITDTNRRQGERWGGVRYNRGYTEPPGLEPLARDLRDNRLPVFPDADDDSYTVAQHRGGLTVNATAYGNPIDYVPADRPANAVDGDPTTAWRAGAFSPVRGERLVVTLDRPVTTDEIVLQQPITGHVNRWITEVRLRFDDGEPVDVALDESSHRPPGQVIEFPERRFRELDIEIVDDTAGRRLFGYLGVSSTGFAEIRIGDLRLDEVIRLPTDLLDAAGPDSVEHPLAVVLSRQRTAPTEITRTDEELAIVRAVNLPAARDFALSGAVRLSTRVGDDVVDRVLGLPDATVPGGVTTTSSSRLPHLAFRSRAALDGDPTTSWSPAFGTQAGQWIDVATERPVTVDRLDLALVADGRHSVPTVLRLETDDGVVRQVPVPPVADGLEAGSTTSVPVALDRPVNTRRIRVVVEAVREVTTIDWYGRDPKVMPVGIAELGIPGVVAPEATGRFDSGCRTDLLTVDGEPVPVAVRGSVADALAGHPLDAAACGDDPVALGRGETVIRAADGRSTGLDLDRLVLRSAAGGGASTATGTVRDEAVAELADAGPALDRPPHVPRVDVLEESSTAVRARVTGASPGRPFWFTLGQSHNDGWRAAAGGRDLGDPTLIDGFANGWLIEPVASSFTVDLRFAPQRRVWIALPVSVAAVALCLALAFTPLGRGRRAEPAGDESPAAFAPRDLLEYPGRRPSPRRAIGVALLLGAVGAVLVNPAVGLGLAAASGIGLRWRRARPWLLLAAPAALVGALAYVLVWQFGHEIPPGFDWPAAFGRAHPIGWLAVLLLGIDVVVARAWRSQ